MYQLQATSCPDGCDGRCDSGWHDPRREIDPPEPALHVALRWVALTVATATAVLSVVVMLS